MPGSYDGGAAAFWGLERGLGLFWTNGNELKSFKGSKGNLKCNTI